MLMVAEDAWKQVLTSSCDHSLGGFWWTLVRLSNKSVSHAWRGWPPILSKLASMKQSTSSYPEVLNVWALHENKEALIGKNIDCGRWRTLKKEKRKKWQNEHLFRLQIKRALLNLPKNLKILGWDIISTGGTKVALDNAGLIPQAIDDVTGFRNDGTDGRPPPIIHGSRLSADSHLQAAKWYQIELIDLVVVVTPFKETILKPDVTYADAVENTISVAICFRSAKPR